MTQNLSADFSRRKFVKSPPTVASIKSPPTYWRNLFDLRKRCPENFSCCGEDGAGAPHLNDPCKRARAQA